MPSRTRRRRPPGINRTLMKCPCQCAPFAGMTSFAFLALVALGFIFFVLICLHTNHRSLCLVIMHSARGQCCGRVTRADRYLPAALMRPDTFKWATLMSGTGCKSFLWPRSSGVRLRLVTPKATTVNENDAAKLCFPFSMISIFFGSRRAAKGKGCLQISRRKLHVLCVCVFGEVSQGTGSS